MAEGFARSLKAESIEAYSAGTEPDGMNRLAVAAMAEAGVDISSHKPKHVDELKELTFDYVVTVCDSAYKKCPLFPGQTKVVHVGFEDPPRLARRANSDDEALPHFRKVRDEIRAFIESLPQALDKG